MLEGTKEGMGGENKKKEQSEGGWEQNWERKKEEAREETRIKVSCICFYCFLLHGSHKPTMSLKGTHFSEHTHDIISGSRLASGLATFLCYSKAGLDYLSVGT